MGLGTPRYPTSATSEDWFYGEDANGNGANGGLQPYALCIELRPASSPGFLLPPDEIVASGEEMVPALLLFMTRAAAQPLGYIQYNGDSSGPATPAEIGPIDCGMS